MKGSSAIRLFVQDIWAGRVGKGREALVGRAHGRGRGRRARASREPGAPLGPPGSRLVLRSFLPRLGIIGWSARLTRHTPLGAALVTRFGNAPGIVPPPGARTRDTRSGKHLALVNRIQWRDVV